MKALVLLFLTMFALAGCASLNPLSGLKGGTIQEQVGNDLTRTSELAKKYGASEISTCVDYLNGIAGNGDTLANEPTAGLISFAVKAYLLKNSSASSEAAFKGKCGAMATGVMIEAAKKAPIGGQLVR